MFGDKLKKLRGDNHLTQEELADRLSVTRTAVSKWETNAGYPSIDSLKELSRLFGVTIDELISDEDVENQRLLEEAQSRKFYWLAMGCLVLATGATLTAYLLKLRFLSILSFAGAAGYLIFAILSKPKYKRVAARKMVAPYILSRLVILAVMIVAAIMTISALSVSQSG